MLLSVLTKSQEWEIVSLKGPGPRYINQLVYSNDGILLFGGKHNNNKGYSDLWKWDGKNWNLLDSASTVGKRWDHSYVFMSEGYKLFLFGGRTFRIINGKEERTDLNDNWIYKNGKWEELIIKSPQVRSSHALAFDINNEKVILFGGRNKNNVFGDTWAFNGKKWEQLDISGPPQRFGHTLVYDPISEAIYLFGGHDGEKLLNDFWSYKDDQWIELKTKHKPSPRMAHSMQFDNNGKAILFGGWDNSNSVSGELWKWSDKEWNILDLEKVPQARLSHAIGFDIKNEEFLLFGGSTGFSGKFLSETWKLRAKS